MKHGGDRDGEDRTITLSFASAQPTQCFGFCWRDVRGQSGIH